MRAVFKICGNESQPDLQLVRVEVYVFSKPTSSINCEFIDYCSNKDFSQFKCPYVFIPVEGEIFLIQLKRRCSLILTPFCLSAEQNRTNCVDFV